MICVEHDFSIMKSQKVKEYLTTPLTIIL